MENIQISLNAVLPMFLIIGVGCLVKHLHLISPEAVGEANTLCFKLFMSTLLFRTIYTADLGAAFDPLLLGLCFLGALSEFLLGLFLIPRLEKAPPSRGVMLQAFFRSNTILLGIPIATSLFGADGLGPVPVITAVIVPTFNTLAVLSLEMNRGGSPTPRQILRGIARNPFIIGTVLGLVTVLLGIRLPQPVDSAVASLAAAATPLSLLLMGASLDFSRLKGAGRNLIICVVERLVIMPAIFLTIAAAMGFRGVSLCGVLLVFGTPVAVNSYNMALQMDGDADLAGGIVLLTTGLSCLTLFLWIWLLKSLGLL